MCAILCAVNGLAFKAHNLIVCAFVEEAVREFDSCARNDGILGVKFLLFLLNLFPEFLARIVVYATPGRAIDGFGATGVKVGATEFAGVIGKHGWFLWMVRLWDGGSLRLGWGEEAELGLG